MELIVALPCVDECPSNCSLDCRSDQKVTVHRVPFPTLALFEKHMSLRVLAFSLSYLLVVLYGLRVVGRKRVDLVVAMYHTIHLAPFAALLISKFAHAPLLVKCHDVVPTGSRWGFLEKVLNTFTSQLDALALRRAAKILALSSELAFIMRELYGIPEHKFFIVPNSVDTDMFECSTGGSVIREKLGLRNTKILLYMGSVEPPYRKEGVKFMMRAMPKAVAQISDLSLLIVGSMSKGVRQDLMSLASSLGIQKHLVFVETVPHEDMPSYISAADICIGPLFSSLETYGSTPRKVIEYMACGKPIIVSKEAVSSDMIDDSHTGIVVNYGDTERLASRVVELLQDSTVARRIGIAARNRAVEYFNEDIVADKLAAESERLVRGGPA